MATTRNIYKQLATMEDIAQGVGSISQQRGGQARTVHRMDVPFAVETQAEMEALDVNVFTRARVYSTTSEYADYVYDVNATSGIPSTGPGFWVQVPLLTRGNLGSFAELKYTNVADLVLGAPVPATLNSRVSTGGTTWLINATSGLPLDNGLFALPEGEVWAQDFGFVEGIGDKTSALEQAIVYGNVVRIKKGTYNVFGELALKDNLQIIAEEGTVFKGQITPEGTGGYPNTILNVYDKINIRIDNITFDFDRGAVTYDSGPALTSKSGWLFELCNNIEFNNCHLTEYVSNRNTDDETLFCVAVFLGCDNIVVNRLNQTRILEEGIRFYDCENVAMYDSRAYSNMDGTSSFYGFWRCDGVLMMRADVTLTGGSVINCYSRNVVLDGIVLNAEIGPDGRGIDLANEGQTQLYDCYNIEIRNCEIQATRYGVQGGAYDESYGSDGLSIYNNKFNIIEEGGFLQGIRIDTCQLVNIENNEILLGDASTAALGRCVLISNNALANKDIQRVKVQNNKMRGLCGVAYQSSQSVVCDSIIVEGNDFESQDKNALASISGASCFFFIRSLPNQQLVKFKNIDLRANLVKNIGGGLFVVSDESVGNIISLGRVNIESNEFRGDTVNNADRFVFALNTAQNEPAVFRFVNNNIFDSHSMRINDVDAIIIEGNYTKWLSTPAPVARIRITNCSDFLKVKDNVFFNASNNRFDVEDVASTVLPKFVDVTKNVTFNDLGAQVFDSEFTNSTYPVGQ